MPPRPALPGAAADGGAAVRAPPRFSPHPSASPSNDFILALGGREKERWQHGGSSQRSAGAEPPGGCSAQGAGARGGGGRAAQPPAPAPRPWRRGEQTPANLGNDTRICTSFTLKNEAEEADAGAGDASRLRKGAIVALKIRGRISHVSARGIFFWGGAVLETNEDKSALELLHTGH